MRCPFCGERDTKVTDSRATDDGCSVRRRRECVKCGRRFTTYETVDRTPLIVVKKDGSREAFDRNKILTGLMRACEKRPVSVAELETLATSIELTLRNQLKPEVTSKDIGELVMEKLRDLDEVAYVRFASVYRQFRDITRFKQELESLLEKR
ncbi:MAG: transcriptional regulator NrdR [Bacillota bacterium]|nr:transcriptional repressor NrdR [Bacillota bacterium]HOB91084.1 transcriptional regulator NrdR [Bacillota bacterium]HPZ54210.1 transcriptional regulator NrdR [Bacillota bacterium]HQD18305.1 transcriptional regulator NrdR [Bacillota bacterium]